MIERTSGAPAPCPGPLVWHDLDGEPPAAVLDCASCDYVIATGGFNDTAHAGTEVLKGA